MREEEVVLELEEADTFTLHFGKHARHARVVPNGEKWKVVIKKYDK